MFSDLLQLFSHDILRICLAAYGDLLEHYRVFFRIAVTLWVLSIAFDALQSDASFRPVVIRFLRGAVVIAYLAEPAVPRAFVELLAAPADSSGILVGHVLKSTGGTADFGASLDRLLVDVRARSLDLTQPGLFDIDLMGYLVVLFIYVLLTGFLAVVLYIAALATFFQAALLFLLPLAVSFYPWSYTRPLFDGVIRQGISFSLVMPLLNVLLALVISPLVMALEAPERDLFALIPFGCLAIVGSLLALQIPAVASGVAGGIGLPILKPR
jgi:hypothetical protein